MRERSKRRFRDLTNVFVLDETWNDHLNAAYGEFWQAARWPFRLTTATKTLGAGDHSVDLLTTEVEMLSDVYDMTQDRALQLKPKDGTGTNEIPMRLRLFLENQDSEPIFYEIVGTQLFIFPAPKTDSHEIRIYYHLQDPSPMALDNDEPAFPLRYHDAVVSGALAKAALDDANLDQAVAYKNEFNAILQQAFRELHPKGPLQEALDERFAKLDALRGGAPKNG